jgi:cold shock CspA family protein
MTLIDRILGRESEPEPEPERIEGKIVKLDDGWGFVASKAIPYTRIFFHWSALNQDTLHFTQLKKGMTIEFEPLEIPDRGLRAIKIKVIDEDHDEI